MFCRIVFVLYCIALHCSVFFIIEEGKLEIGVVFVVIGVVVVIPSCLPAFSKIFISNANEKVDSLVWFCLCCSVGRLDSHPISNVTEIALQIAKEEASY